MRSSRPVSLLATAVAALAATGAVAVPVAGAAKAQPKLWAVSLSGTAQTADGYSSAGLDSVYGSPPAGCLDNTTTTYRLRASARMIARPVPQPLSPGLGTPLIPVRVVLSSLHASASDEVAGSWTVDPNYSPDGFTPQPVDPSVCAFTPFTVTSGCTFPNRQTHSYTLNLSLSLPDRGDPLSPPGRFFLYYSGESGGETPVAVVACPQQTSASGSPVPVAAEDGDIPFLQEELATNLRTRAVFGLRRGRSASASGTIVFRLNLFSHSQHDCIETITYSLKVKRVR
jgi:hypothetical protein